MTETTAKDRPITLEQERAQHAWEKARDGSRAYGDAYVNLAKGLPALLMNSGLMQTLAFLEEKGGQHRLLGEHLRDWLHTRFQTPTAFSEFMETLMNAEPRKFQDITREAYAWLKWLRQLAAAQEAKK